MAKQNPLDKAQAASMINQLVGQKGMTVSQARDAARKYFANPARLASNQKKPSK